MSCLEHNRLRQHYQAALRHWGRVLFSPDAHLVGTAARKAAEIKQKAFDERNTAKERLDVHTLSCRACNPELRGIHRRVN